MAKESIPKASRQEIDKEEKYGSSVNSIFEELFSSIPVDEQTERDSEIEESVKNVFEIAETKCTKHAALPDS